MEGKNLDCHNCHKKIKIIYIHNGGVVGDCRPCDRLQWVIPPTIAVLLGIKYSSEQKQISREKLSGLMERSKNEKQ
jgi:hypothetical protein